MELLILLFAAITVIFLLKTIVETIIRILINFIKTIVFVLIILLALLFLTGKYSIFETVLDATAKNKKPAKEMQQQMPVRENTTATIEN